MRFCAGLHKLGIIVMATSSIFANVETKCNADCKKLVAALKRAKEKQANRKKFYFSLPVEEVKGEQVKDIFAN